MAFWKYRIDPFKMWVSVRNLTDKPLSVGTPLKLGDKRVEFEEVVPLSFTLVEATLEEKLPPGLWGSARVHRLNFKQDDPEGE